MQDQSKVICPRSSVAKVLARLGVADSVHCPDERDKQLLCRAVEDMLERSMEFGALLARGSGTGWMLVRVSGPGSASIHKSNMFQTEDALLRPAAHKLLCAMSKAAEVLSRALCDCRAVM